jgi:hypothetical protein
MVATVIFETNHSLGPGHGQVLKWTTRPDCKSGVIDFPGSNPGLPTMQWSRTLWMCGRSSGVELQPSKLAVASSNLVARSNLTISAHVAQLAEHVLGKDEVTRSIRVVGSSMAPWGPALSAT